MMDDEGSKVLWIGFSWKARGNDAEELAKLLLLFGQEILLEL
jgi:hypothetical protein